jgi:hypothetical protein
VNSRRRGSLRESERQKRNGRAKSMAMSPNVIERRRCASKKFEAGWDENKVTESLLVRVEPSEVKARW